MSFLASLGERARPLARRVGFPEADEPRTARAMERLAREGWVEPVAVEDPGGEALERAVERLRDGGLDGVVAGAGAPTAEVVRAGLRILGPAPGVSTVSGGFYVVPARAAHPTAGVITFVDAAVVPHPTAEQLAEIAAAACDARGRVVGDEPRVAFLSYSTRGSAGGESPARMREALEIFRARRPEVVADGEVQADAALVPEVAERKSPGSPLGGRANVLVFPCLDAGNLAYKLVERLGGATALGPILHGLARPLNDLSRGASPDDIVHVACITALMTAPPTTPGRGEPGTPEEK